MRKVGVGLTVAATAIALILCGSKRLGAQPLANRMAVSVDFGPAVPTGDLAADFDKGGGNASTGILGGLSIERMLNESFGVALGLRYVRFGLDTEGLLDASLKIPEIDFSGLYFFSPESSTRPFVTGGVTFAKPRVGVEAGGNKRTSTLDWVVGFHGGGGVMHMLNQTTGLFGAVEYNHLATDGTDYTVEANGVKFPELAGKETMNYQWVSIRGGITVFFGGS